MLSETQRRADKLREKTLHWSPGRPLNKSCRGDRAALLCPDEMAHGSRCRSPNLKLEEVNKRMEELLHGDTRWMEGPPAPAPVVSAVVGGITSEEEELHLEGINELDARGGDCRAA